MTLSIRAEGEALLLKVTARPGASRSAVQAIQGDALKVAIAAPPERGKANKQLVVFLAKALGLRRSQVQLVLGQNSREKTLRVEGLAEGQLRERIAELL